MTAPVFILPTAGATTYRGKYPSRARSISAGTGGLHVELNDGTRLWTAKGSDHFLDLPPVGHNMLGFRAKAVPMTAEQYETLATAGRLVRERAHIAGHGRRAEMDSRIRALVNSIQPATVEPEAQERLERPFVESEEHGADGCPGPRTIEMTPTWAGMGGTFRMLIENGTDEGRRTAWEQISRALELADERNTLAKELARYESAELSDVVQEYALKGDGCQAAGAIVLRRLAGNDGTPFVVHFRNDADSERTGRPCYYFGDYCNTLADAWEAFAAKVRRFDPTGELGS